jgi:hypothetical protein
MDTIKGTIAHVGRAAENLVSAARDSAGHMLEKSKEGSATVTVAVSAVNVFAPPPSDIKRMYAAIAVKGTSKRFVGETFTAQSGSYANKRVEATLHVPVDGTVCLEMWGNSGAPLATDVLLTKACIEVAKIKKGTMTVTTQSGPVTAITMPLGAEVTSRGTTAGSFVVDLSCVCAVAEHDHQSAAPPAIKTPSMGA